MADSPVHKLSPAQRLVTHIVLIVLCIPFVMPLVWMLSTSLKTDDQIFPREGETRTLSWQSLRPDPVQWSNYPEALKTVPFGLYCYTITVLWYALHGHHPQDAAEHRTRAPWYITKTHPAFSDMAAKLRRTIIAARFMPIDAGQPTDTEIRAVQEAWATASADLA